MTKNRQYFVDDQMAGQLLDAIVEQARQRQLLSEQHFCVDGTLIDAWASMGSYRRQELRPAALYQALSTGKGYTARGTE